jgi:hypothetical protein
MTHDYKRNGTIDLYAALDILSGEAVGQCTARHRHQEFLSFLRKLDREFPRPVDLHVVLDNSSTPLTSQRPRLARQPPPLPPPLRADQLLLAQHGRGCLR